MKLLENQCVEVRSMLIHQNQFENLLKERAAASSFLTVASTGEEGEESKVTIEEDEDITITPISSGNIFSVNNIFRSFPLKISFISY